jgi:hypothetical protein
MKDEPRKAVRNDNGKRMTGLAMNCLWIHLSKWLRSKTTGILLKAFNWHSENLDLYRQHNISVKTIQMMITYIYIYIYIYIVISSQGSIHNGSLLHSNVQYTTLGYSSQFFWNSNTRTTSTNYSEYVYCLLASALVL